MNRNDITKEIKEISMLSNAYNMVFDNEDEIKKVISFTKAYNFKNGWVKDLILSDLENKLLGAIIEKTATKKVAYHLKGLLNLLNDKLPYNSTFTKGAILKDLKAIKSFKSFKVVNISTYNLKKGYKYLAYKNDSILNYSKIIRLEKTVF